MKKNSSKVSRVGEEEKGVFVYSQPLKGISVQEGRSIRARGTGRRWNCALFASAKKQREKEIIVGCVLLGRRKKGNSVASSLEGKGVVDKGGDPTFSAGE